MMLSLEEARAAILGAVRPAHEVETLALADACGRYLAAEVRAAVDNPAFDNSAMDGYALRVADLAASGHCLPLAGEASAGDAPRVLPAGACMRIFTGAPLPDGADAVVMQEDVTPAGERMRFPPETAVGDHVRRRGEDFRAGEALYAPGRRLTPYDVALLGAAGAARVEVWGRARVLVIATGNELVVPGEALAPGQIYESNRLPTILQLRALGAEVVDGGMVRDDPQSLRALLARATDFDFVITSGGASVGDRDLVKQVFAEIGTINFWKARIKPGKPIAFGHLGERAHFFALPGNPVSSLVTFKLFVEPALVHWHHGSYQMAELPAVAANAFRRKPGRTEFLRARLEVADGALRATVLKGQGSHQLAALRETNGFIRVETEADGFEAGAPVMVVPLGGEILL